MPEAAGRAIATACLSVLFAGFTVLLALCGLVLSRIPVFMTMGFTTGLVVAATVLSALTLLPRCWASPDGGCCAAATAPPAR